MRNIRIYADSPLSVSARLVLPGNASRHLLRVLRCRRGAELTLFNGEGGSFSSRIVSAANQSVEVEIVDFYPETPGDGLDITLGLGISRGSRMDYAVQKSVELGVSTIAPLFTERSNVKLDQKRVQTRLEHWKKIIIHACEQSGRNILPTLSAPRPFIEWVSRDDNTAKFLLAPDARHTISTISAIEGGRNSILIGPEGGLTDEEREMAEKQGYVPIRLGPRTLRTETAVAAAITSFQVLWGDLR